MTAVKTAADLNTAIIGAGFIGEVHARAARNAGARLHSIASARPGSAAAFAERLGIPAARSVEEVLNDDTVDVVHICSPNGTHADYAEAAIERGKHVVCEKPLTTTAADADRLVALARDAGVVAVVPFAYRYHPMAHELRARVLGDAGSLISVAGEYLQDWRLTHRLGGWWTDPVQTGPSRAFADIGSHVCDMIQFVSGQPIVAVCAVTVRVDASSPDGRPLEGEDVATALIELADGTTGTVTVSQMAMGRKNALRLQIAGRTASYEFKQETPDELWVGQAEQNLIVSRQASHLSDAAAQLSIVPAGHPMGYQDAFNGLIADAYRAISGRPRHGVLPTFDDGARMVRLTEAVLRSASTRSWVAVEQGEIP